MTKMGRPNKPDSEKRSRQVSVFYTEDEYEQVKHYANQEGEEISRFIRRASLDIVKRRKVKV